MKKFINLLPVAGLLALASCSNDDYLGKNKDIDLSGKVVLKVYDGDEVTTRARKDMRLHSFYDNGDIIRVYDSNVVKYDEFVFTPVSGDENYFLLPDEQEEPFVEKNAEGEYDYAYALFGAGDEKNISYAGWKDGSQIALLNIQGEYKYDEKEDDCSVDGKVMTYKSILPMFGVVSKSTGDRYTSDNPGVSFETTMYSLVGRARIVFENGNGLGVKKVRMRAVSFATNGKEAFEQLTLKQQDAASTYESYVTTNDDTPKLTGWFEAILDKDIATKTDGGLQKAEDYVNKSEEQKSEIVMTVDSKKMDDYTSVVTFPVVPGTYDLLLFEYAVENTGADKEQNPLAWHYIHHVTGKVERSTNILPDEITASIILDEETLIPGEDDGMTKGLQNVIKSYLEKTAGKDLAITIPGDIDVRSTGGYKDNYKKLVLPVLTNDLTLNFEGKINGVSDDNTLYIEVAEGSTGKLTINYTESTDQQAKPCSIDITAGSSLAIKGKYTKSININKADDLELNGEFADVKAENGVSGDIEVQGTFTSAINLITSGGDITIGQTTFAGDNILASYSDVAEKTAAENAKVYVTGAITNAKTLEIVAGTTNINANITSTERLITNGNVTVAKDAVITGNWTQRAGELVLNGRMSSNKLTVYTSSFVLGTAEGSNGYINNLELKSGALSAVINGTVAGTLTTNGAPVKVIGKVNKLEIAAPVATPANELGGIVVNGGTISGYINGYEGENAAKTKIHSIGKADIKSVTKDDNLEFTSAIDSETSAVALTETSGAVNIYTGAQLLSLQGATSVSATTVNLNTDVTATNVEWIPSAVLNSKATAFNGNNHIVSGLKIVTTSASKQNVAFFSQVNNTSDVIVKDLNLTGLSYDGEATGILAGLMGTVSSNATVQNVNVTGSKLYGAESVYCVGGLIARVQSGNVTIQNSTVTFDEIAGKQYVGGLIGDDYNANETTKTITVTGGDKNLVTLTKLTSSTDATTANIATFGMLVGAVRKAGTTLSITGDKLYSSNLIAGHRTDFLYDKRTYTQDGVTFKFSGVDGNYIGYSAPYDYSNNSSNKNSVTNVTINTKNYTWNELNKFVSTYEWTE